jgi:hypothetical protein
VLVLYFIRCLLCLHGSLLPCGRNVFFLQFMLDVRIYGRIAMIDLFRPIVSSSSVASPIVFLSKGGIPVKVTSYIFLPFRMRPSYYIMYKMYEMIEVILLFSLHMLVGKTKPPFLMAAQKSYSYFRAFVL